jgi:hypothetical protein
LATKRKTREEEEEEEEERDGNLMVTLANISANLCHWQHIACNPEPSRCISTLAAFLLSLSGPISATTPALPISPIFIPIQIMICGLLCRCREMKPVVVSLFNKQERDRFYCQV